VTASGEIKPRNYINLGANAQGPITELLVKEGDHVRKGQVVARIERIQPQADLEAQRAAVASAIADASAAEAGLKAQDQAVTTMQATLDRSKSDLELARLNFERYEQMYKSQLIARQEYEQMRANFNSAEATVRETAARLSQVQAQRVQTAAQSTASSGASPKPRPCRSASRMYLPNSTSLRRSMVWSPICPCAWAKQWCLEFRTPRRRR